MSARIVTLILLSLAVLTSALCVGCRLGPGSDEETPRQREIRRAVLAAGDQAVGARVFHQKFGYGTVRKVEGERLTIAFDQAGDKKVMASFVVPEDQAG